MIPLLLLALTGCLTQPLSPGWLVDRTRVLAARAEPAEPQPGQTVTFSSLVVDPDQDPYVLWTGCLLELSGSYGCELPEGDDGFLGFEPLFTPSLAVPADLLDDLPEEQRAEGKNYILSLAALSEDVDLSDPEAIGEDDILEVAYKRMPVSLSTTPNHNPDIDHVLLDGDTQLRRGAVVEVQRGQSYTFEPIFADGSVETYTYITSDGVAEDRVEEPYFTYFTTDGDFNQDYALYPYTEFTWTAPVDPERAEVSLWLVARDRRGGMDWFRIDLTVNAE